MKREIILPAVVSLVAGLSVMWQLGVFESVQPERINLIPEEFAHDGKGVEVKTALQWPGKKPAQFAGKSLLVLMGACDSCTARKFEPGMESKGKYAHVIMVYDGRPSEGKIRVNPPYYIAVDPKATLSLNLKATNYPRGYEIDENWRVVKAGTKKDGQQLVSN
jgi:hypothetical protein